MAASARASAAVRAAPRAHRRRLCARASAHGTGASPAGGEWRRGLAAAGAAAAVALSLPGSVSARLEGVNKPELLPAEYTTVIDVAGFLTPGEESRIASKVDSIEKDTGIKLRVLAQNYPQTPGLAIRDFWGVDDDTVVFVADPNTGNILNFNVGANVDLAVPRNFWTRLAGKYGTKFYWQNNGEGDAIQKAVNAISTCVHEPPGRGQCAKVYGDLDTDL
mmetsp:Transcript_20424/g.69486  ORF Transcript_20424/g.69486 Transcript_20424/m.69486 type:complete len:220 (+) Transcript_20424:39-698(+)